MCKCVLFSCDTKGYIFCFNISAQSEVYPPQATASLGWSQSQDTRRTLAKIFNRGGPKSSLGDGGRKLSDLTPTTSKTERTGNKTSRQTFHLSKMQQTMYPASDFSATRKCIHIVFYILPFLKSCQNRIFLKFKKKIYTGTPMHPVQDFPRKTAEFSTC